MNIFLIFKQFMDYQTGQVYNVELVECDTDEHMAQRFAKLYNLQTPADLKNKISYNYIGTRVQ
jgi:hypothetical protein